MHPSIVHTAPPTYAIISAQFTHIYQYDSVNAKQCQIMSSYYYRYSLLQNCNCNMQRQVIAPQNQYSTTDILKSFCLQYFINGEYGYLKKQLLLLSDVQPVL